MSATALPEPSAGQRFFKLYLRIGLPVFLAFIDQTIVAAALPAIAADFHDLARVAWCVVAYLTATAISAPVYGQLGDTFGRRRLLLVALSVYTLGSVICAMAPSMDLLIAGRVVQGLGAGGLMTLTQALISEAVGARDRARYQGYLATTAITASALGPVIGGMLTNEFGWRSIFTVNLPFAALSLFLILGLPASRGTRKPLRFDWLGLGFFTVAIVSLLLLIEMLRRPQTDLPALATLAILMVVGTLALIWQERRAPDPLLPPSLLAMPAIWRGDVLVMCQGALLMALLTFTPIYLRAAFGVTSAEIGLLMIPVSIGVGLGAMTTGQLVGRTGRTSIFPLLGMSAAVILLSILALTAGAMPRWGLAFYLGLVSLSLGTVMAVVQVVVQHAAGPNHYGAAAANVQLARAVGSALGTAVIGAIILGTAGLQSPAAAAQLQAMMQGAAATGLPDAAMREVVDIAYRMAFIALAVVAAIAAFTAWALPIRRI